jgi:ketosteroid isomerase-like protein
MDLVGHGSRCTRNGRAGPKMVGSDWISEGRKTQLDLIRPLDVKVRGNVGLLFAYIQDSSTDDFGGIWVNRYKALVVFHKEEGSYKLIGGMYVPVLGYLGAGRLSRVGKWLPETPRVCLLGCS